ncbi:hypothetical protein [Streptomyces buecherae]|uniref:Uncharacterized protein n=1 Tax=Streptomyces buecherae TaxID=2763006 RepID=A0A7H8NBS0_9ACTN|nr:hypothetical protein [Streptomyces buecherae]QKW51816.1 hypothetical protein HUT08_22350 [Streptomyces buecherae]
MSFGQGGPYGPGGSQPPTPDWSALADTAARDRRRRWLLFGGGALAAAAIAAIVATAVIVGDDDGGKGDRSASQLPTPAELPSESAQSEPTFSDVDPPAPISPLEVISDRSKDTAPITAAGLFPGDRATVAGRDYTKGATASTKDCGSVAQKKLYPALTGNGCRQVVRATYTNGDVAVTVGIAVFDTKAAAEKAKAAAGPFLVSLPGDGVERFCRNTACRSTSNAIGRYGYFTIAGNTDGSPVRTDETKARQAGLDVAEHAFSRIMQRANAQASAAATAR